MNQKLFNELISEFKNTQDAKGNILNMHYFLIKEKDRVYCHNFNNRQVASDIRSISKTVLTLLAGIVMDLSAEGKYPPFDQDTYVFPLLKDAVKLSNLGNQKQLEKVQVKHLITHTVGYDQVLLMRGDIQDMDPFTYLDYVINAPIQYEPGKYYLYSNAGFYLLSALLQEFLKEDLLEFADRHLFKPLGIKDYSWDRYGNYLAGATRLKMYPKDLLKIGQVLMDKGVYHNKQIVCHEWIKKMLVPTTYTPHVDTPHRVFRRYAYGSGIWLAKDAIFFGHGTDGQILAMIPEKEAIIVSLAHQNDITEIENIVNDVILHYL